MEQNVMKCKKCGARTSVKRTDPDMPKEGHTCVKCGRWVCGECTDWNASPSSEEIICQECAGRSAPKQCGCE